MTNWSRSRDDAIDPPIERTRELLASKSAADVELQTKRREAMTSNEAVTVVFHPTYDDGLLSEARTYITLRKELIERGQKLKARMDTKELAGQTLVVRIDELFYELARAYSDSLPLTVRTVAMLGND